MIEKEFPARLDALDDVLGFLEGTLEEAGCDMKTMMQCSVAMEEMFVNVAHYAYPEGIEGKVWIGLSIEDRVATMRLEDAGQPFDPLAKEDPDVSLGADDRDIGGLGIYMVKKSMDSVEYAYDKEKNIFTMTKKF